MIMNKSNHKPLISLKLSFYFFIEAYQTMPNPFFNNRFIYLLTAVGNHFLPLLQEKTVLVISFPDVSQLHSQAMVATHVLRLSSSKYFKHHHQNMSHAIFLKLWVFSNLKLNLKLQKYSILDQNKQNKKIFGLGFIHFASPDRVLSATIKFTFN